MNGRQVSNGQEQYEQYISSVRKKVLVQYDYRDHDGELFSCVRPTLEECRAKRDEWLARKAGKIA